MEEPKFALVESELIYKGAILSLYHEKIKSAQGRVMEREVVRHVDAVGIVALDGDNVVLIKQYRHPIGENLLEIPAGLLRDYEEAAACAVRELKEETGYIAKKVEKIAEFYTSAGFTDERFHLFFSDELEAGEPEPEPGEEDLTVVEIPLKEAVDLVAQGKMKDAKTVVAVLMAAQKVGRIEL